MKIQILLKTMLMAIALVIVGCGGSEDEKNDVPNPTNNTPPTISGINESYIVPALGELIIKASVSDADNDALSIIWEQTSGTPLWQVQPTDSELSLKMPLDNGLEQIFEVKAIVNDGKENVSYTTTITVPTSTAQIINDVSEHDGSYSEEAPDSDLILTIESINSRGVLEASANKFEINFTSNTGATFKFDEETEITLHSGEAVKITDFFNFDETKNLLYVKEESLFNFTSLLQQTNDLIELGISGYDSYGFDISKEVSFYYGYGVIKGTLVDENGNAYGGLEGETIEIRGGFNSKTYNAIIKADSTFEFIDLPADTYNVNLLTSDFKIAVSSVLIDFSSPNIEISPQVIDLQTADTNSGVKAKKFSATLKASPERLQYHYAKEHSFGKKELQLKAVDEELIGTITATSASQGVSVSKKETFVIPKEITEIKVVSTVTSTEFPEWTTVQSEYNDAWQYSYLIGTRTKFKQGNVNSTHASAGTISNSEVYEVNKNPNAPAEKVTLFASATNIGDDVVPTSVTLEIYQAGEELSIKEFRHKEGLGLGKTGRWHIGVGPSTHKQWTATIVYSPEESDLNKAECKFKTATQEFLIDNFNIVKKNPGQAEIEMGFSGITVPSLGNTHGKIECDFEAINSKNNVISTSQPSIMEMAAGKDSLIPLTRYSTGSRYGSRDIGQDDWMRANTLQYMSNSRLVYNDASREHGGCYVSDANYTSYNKNTSCSKAIRDHNSHRDGTSVDTRYPTKTMNNPIINLRSKLGQTVNNPAVAKEVKDWVMEARGAIDNITSSTSVKKVYVAKQMWLKTLLNKGKDENGNLVDGLTPWSTKSPKVEHYKGHSNHIHIEFYP
ncbi:carboxypeptidase-like regulatory domain-containing protein [Pseudoalteromonas spongiae]|uniref:carboxypeptidase-like regulatory domain-containing protein n=1 Tax=Pseudoalteromonas spongiae TaxID=298657 RepID=UPI00110A71AA|nr:carboxypeptidase-like regulatory domain-containing protein [Pseudoalteromonas spongiae]TMO88646.1 hypothetical protein CWC15_01380 [Pseudoalteromonas spongiae]